MRYVETPTKAMLRIFGISASALALLVGAKAALAEEAPARPNRTRATARGTVRRDTGVAWPVECRQRRPGI